MTSPSSEKTAQATIFVMKSSRALLVWSAVVLASQSSIIGGCSSTEPGDHSMPSTEENPQPQTGASADAGGQAAGSGAQADSGSDGGGAQASNDGGGASTGSDGGGAPAGKDGGGAPAEGGAPVDGGGMAGDIGPTSCLPLFMEACTPDIKFTNQEPEGRGSMFARVIPDPVAAMQDAACTVCSILFRSPDEIPRDKRHSVLNLTVLDHTAVASAGGNSIRIDVKHIARFQDPAKALVEFRGILVHETTHLYQNYGNGGLGEGMADFVRIRVGLYEPGRRRPGGSWTDPYTTSGFFFSWLAGPGIYHDDGRDPHDIDIGYKINKRIGEGGPSAIPALFMETFGKDVESLWDEYQADIR
jgi:hypothetical protein